MGSKARPYRRILVVPDVHAPYHDEAAFGLTIKAAKALRPHVIVIIGDFVDCYSVSRFPKDPARRSSLAWEVDEASKLLGRLEGLSDVVHFTEGNHEERLERYIAAQAPELFGLVKMKDLLRVSDRGWTWHPYRKHMRIGKCAFVHEAGSFGVNAIRSSLAAMGCSVVFGHTHRGGTHYEGTIEGSHRFALNVGWLGDIEQAGYMHRALARSWQHGFGVVDQDARGNSWGQFIPIVNGRVMVEGKVLLA